MTARFSILLPAPTPTLPESDDAFQRRLSEWSALDRVRECPPCNTGGGSTMPHTCGGRPERAAAKVGAQAAKAPTLPDLCRTAATAIETLCATLRDCAREVEARSGQRVARNRRAGDTQVAVRALVKISLDATTSIRVEIDGMTEGCWGGYVCPTWALRLMQLAAAAPESRDTVPAEATEDTEPRPAGCLCTWEFGDSACPVHPTCPACGCVVCECRPTEAPEERAGEGGT